MSILLDALKRSEQQRRLGEVPDIHSPLGAESAAGENRNRRLRWILVGIIVVILAWVAWQRIGSDDPPATGGAVAKQASVVDATAMAPGEAGSSAAAATTGNPAENPSAVARTPVETLQRNPDPSRTAAPDPAAPAEQGVPRQSRVNESFTRFEAPAQADSGPGSTDQAPSSVHPAQEPADGVGAAVAEPTGAPRATASQPEATEPISFWELPQSVRDSLPELRITVLVYADRSEDRFVLMAGQRLFEKDEFQPGVVLDEIRRDGAVFLYRNYRFLVKG